MQKKPRSRNDSNGHTGFRWCVTLDSISKKQTVGAVPLWPLVPLRFLLKPRFSLPFFVVSRYSI
jgi:hypothetical protein